MKASRWIAQVVAVSSLLVLPGNALAEDGEMFGLLRARDLTPFGFLRLDMRPAHALTIKPGSWVVEAELAYQNTWALSPEVERYLTELEPTGRRELGEAELQAIRDLPGENYLVDYEAAVLDVAVHHKLTTNLSAYFIATLVSYDGGFLDSTIEEFHDALGFSTFGRPAASRNDVNLLYDLKSSQVAYFEAPTDGGFSDPTVGVRYSGLKLPPRWNLALEAAVKLPVGGRRLLLSTGRTDYGVQASLLRRGNHFAVHANAAAVYYAGSSEPVPQDARVIPTLILGYEYQLTPQTNINLQGYMSTSVYSREQTDLDELLDKKYQVTLGVRHLLNNILLTFGITENIQNFNNTPDIGFQFGIAYVPNRVMAR